MAIKVTNWNWIKSLLLAFDLLIFIINVLLFGLTFYLLKIEYYNRASIKLFIIPFLVSIINILVDFLMNKTNIIMKYAGHNRYGMIARFFMFYFVLTIMIYSDQRERYLLQFKKDDINIDINYFIFIIGIINISLLISSMILSFFVIDVQNFNQISVKKSHKKPGVVGEELGILQNLIPEELK